MDEVAAHLPDVLPEEPDGFIEVFEQARRFLAHSNVETDRQRAALLNILHGLEKKSVTLKRWAPNQKFAKALRDEKRGDFIERVTRPVSSNL